MSGKKENKKKRGDSFGDELEIFWLYNIWSLETQEYGRIFWLLRHKYNLG